MVNAIKALPRWVEFCLVITICFGLFIYTSLAVLVKTPASFVHDNAPGLAIVGFEVVATALALVVLRWRGWQFPGICAMHLTWRSTVLGVTVIACIYYSYHLLSRLTLTQSDTPALPSPAYANVMSLGVLLLVSVINPLFEEVFVSGYIITALRGKGVFVALVASVLIRTSYQLYRGVPGILLMVPLGLAFGILWELLLAHAQPLAARSGPRSAGLRALRPLMTRRTPARLMSIDEC